jgi:choline dehydrogenase-like flavoprotein
MIDRPGYTRIEKSDTQGKVLGGSSCLNCYTWVRGSAATFDDWESYGGKDWNWEGCKEYFDKVGHLFGSLNELNDCQPASYGTINSDSLRLSQK